MTDDAFTKLGEHGNAHPDSNGLVHTHIPSPTLEHGWHYAPVVPGGPQGRSGTTPRLLFRIGVRHLAATATWNCAVEPERARLCF